MHEEVDYDKLANDNPFWQWRLWGLGGVVTLLQFDDEDVPETEDAEWLEEEG